MPTGALAEHFRGIATRYARVRDLDVHAVRRIVRVVARLSADRGPLRLLDVATGTGRYLEAVCGALSDQGLAPAGAIGVDASPAMLRGDGRTTVAGGPFDADDRAGVAALAEALPIADRASDVVLTFNAIHHLALDEFLAEAARVLRPEGLLVIYTRTPAQNRATVWGQHFPGFAERERRLHTHAELRAALEQNGAFARVRMRAAGWWQFTSLPALVRQARTRHYSTFRFYEPAEFSHALAMFSERLRRRYHYPWAIPVRNNHTIAFARRRA
ncbi:MAG TPA: class I SAM-dependent methyltransferase [Gemmatimonadales bacterium]|nr:class I SAM-dependent methyltransferase [Gemmatimonadales bacterium]